MKLLTNYKQNIKDGKKIKSAPSFQLPILLDLAHQLHHGHAGVRLVFFLDNIY